MLHREQIELYRRDGYLVVRSLFGEDETARLIEHYMRLRADGEYPGDWCVVDPTSADPLKRFPRMIHMHHWDEISLRWLLDARLNACMAALLGNEPYAVQTMFYFKPAGARGQALHQDQYYLRVQPGTSMAAWMALDACDEENGCLQVVPGTQNLPLLCTQEADAGVSFSDVDIPLPEGVSPVPVRMSPGDVLFFNGWIIHGSFPNVSSDRFRRTLIGHYIVAEAENVAQWYRPVLRMDGSEVEIGVSDGGGPCGVWQERNGERVVETVGYSPIAGSGAER